MSEQQPELEYNTFGSGSITLRWPDGSSLTIMDGAIITDHWRIPLPKGFIQIRGTGEETKS